MSVTVFIGWNVPCLMMKYNLNHTIMSETILTNEWTDATTKKPWKDRAVIIRFEDGTLGIGKWNGMYWVGQHDMRFIRTDKITHFYIFENFNQNQ